jgi:hypothetical protein
MMIMMQDEKLESRERRGGHPARPTVLGRCISNRKFPELESQLNH